LLGRSCQQILTRGLGIVGLTPAVRRFILTKMKNDVQAIYTPYNEPYLGRQTLHAFDELIIVCLKTNSKIAPLTYKIEKTDLQSAGCQVIPQGISIVLSIRELIRQGYLFGALVLMRPLIERVVTVMYLHQNPEKIDIWKRGWVYKERPKLAEMLNSIGGTEFPGVGREITNSLNSLTHGDPDSADWNLVEIGNGAVGYGVSKIIDNPNLCDKICLDAVGWLANLLGMMCALFPEAGDSQNEFSY
jgi:hypothetical protein